MEPSQITLTSWLSRKQNASDQGISYYQVDNKECFLSQKDFPAVLVFLGFIKKAVVDVLKKSEDLINKPKCAPLMDTADYMLRAMIAVGTGCDTVPKGVPGISVGKVRDFLKENGNASADDLLQFYVQRVPEENRNGYSDLLRAFAFALVYEPGNEKGDDGIPKYIHGPPDYLPAYLKEFGTGTNIPIRESTGRGDGRRHCCGPCKESHVFLLLVQAICQKTKSAPCVRICFVC